MEFAGRAGDASTARLRRPGPGTFQCAAGALHAARGGRQYADLPALHGRTILPPAAPAGAPSVAQTAYRLHPEEPAAPPRRQLEHPGIYQTALPAAGS